MADVENKDDFHKMEDKLKKDEENENVKTETQDTTDTKESNREPYSETDNIEHATQQTDTQSSSTNKTDIQVPNASNDSKLPEPTETNTADIEDNVNISNENKEAEKTTSKPSEEEKKTQSIKKSNKHTAKTSEKLDESGSIDLKLVQGHYRTHSKSTLPHILTEYGLKEKGHPVIKKEKQKKKKKTVGLLSDADDDDDRTRRKRLHQTYGETRQPDTYYMEYLDFLEQKVIQQRQKAQKDREEAEKLAALRDEEERQKRRHVRRVERVELKHDDSFLKNLPKTDTARIIALQDKMKKDGKLKTQNDVDKFWDDIRKPDVFYQQFKVKKNDSGVTEPHVDQDNNKSCQTGPEGAPATEMPQRSHTGLSHISEARDKESWAITQKYQTSHGPKPPTSERQRKDSTQMAKDAAMDLEKRCPKLEMPPLACFSLRLGEKPPDPEDITKKLDLKSREKTRKKFKVKLNKMYQRAMTNTAVANRILAQHGDLMHILEGAALRDVRDFCCEPRKISPITELAVFDQPYPTMDDYYRDIVDPSRALETLPDDRLGRGSQSQPSTRQSSAASRKLTPISDTPKSRSSSRRMKKSPEMIEYPLPLPLSFGEVTSKEKTMEAKCTSTLWTNYMHAGKTVFAHT